MARIADVLLDLSFFPAGGWIAELGIKDIMAGHGQEPRIHVALLAGAHAVHGRLHVIVDAAAWNSLEDPERVPVRVEQHLVGLEQIRSHQKSTAVRQLDVGDLKFDALAADMGPVLAPVELERLTRSEYQRHECSAIGRMVRALPLALPCPHKGRDPFIRAVKAKLHQISVHLLGRSPFLA